MQRFFECAIQFGGGKLTYLRPFLIVTSVSGFESSQSLEIIGCVSGMRWTCSVIYEVEAINLCSELVATNRMACGSAGDYEFDFSFNLPGKTGQNWLWGYSLHVEAIFADDEGSETICQSAIHTFHSTMALSLVGILLVVSTVTYGWKRRKAATIIEEQGIEFQKMADVP